MSPRITRKKFGEILVEAGVINESGLKQALDRQKQSGHRLGQVLESMGIIKESDIAVVIARQYGYRTVKDFARYHYPPEVLATVAPSKAKRNQIFPLKIDNGTLLLAMVNPLDLIIIDEIEKSTNFKVLPYVTTPKEIKGAIETHYVGRDEEDLGITVSNNEWYSILVADADKNSRTKLLALLKKSGYHAEEASTKSEALVLSMQLSPHLILVGTTHPEQLNALELFRSIRGAIPCLALGWASIEEEISFLNTGFIDYISPPHDPSRILARIRRALKLSQEKNTPS